MGELFAWWLAVELIGVAGLPLSALVLANLPDRGWALTKPLSLIAFGWLVWFPLATISALPYSPGWIVGVFLVFAAANVALYRRAPRVRAALRQMLAHERVYVVACELIFAGSFGFMAWLRSFTPAVVDTEKFMDVAFLSSLWRTPHLPAPDPWLSGAPINYYYFGHFLLATIAKVLSTQPGAAFNIGIALIFALTALAVFAVAANLVAVARRGTGPRAQQATIPPSLPARSSALHSRASYAPGGAYVSAGTLPPLQRAIPYGVASVLLVLVLGNLNGAQLWWQQALAETGHGLPLANPWQWWLHRDLWLDYNWWNPSRVIPNTINEFPAFSFILSDLHAHILALPFAALAVGIAFNLLLARGEGIRAFGTGSLGLLALVTSGVAIGGLYAINGWDLPTYLGLALLALAIQQYLAHDRRISSVLLLDLFSSAALLVACCFLAYLPFYRGFVSPSQGIGTVPADQRTPVGYEFAIFGLPLFILGSLLIWRIVQWAGAALEQATADALANSDAATQGGVWTWLDGRARWVGGACAALILGLLLLWTARSPGNTGFTLFWCLLIIILCAALVLHHLGVFRSPAETPSVGASGRADSSTDDTASTAELWILCLVGTVAALVAAAEIIYLRDIFNSRMNTVFKLYFQSWLLLGIAAGPALAWLLPAMRRQLAGLFAPIAAPREYPAEAPVAGALALAGSARFFSRAPYRPPIRGTLATTSKSESDIPAESATASGSPLPVGGACGAASDQREAERAERAPVGQQGMRLPSLPFALRWLRAGGILIWMGALAVLVCAALVYPVLAASARTANFSLPRTLDGTAYMATDPTAAAVGCNGDAGAGSNHDDNEAIAWLNTHITGSPVIVEAPGCEWSHYSRISSLTGLPTLIGWPGGHEGEWRANWLNAVSPNDPFGGRYFGQRVDAVNRIYTDPNTTQVIALLKQYHVRLVYVGVAERQLYATADLSRFGTFLRVIYTHGGVTIYEVPW